MLDSSLKTGISTLAPGRNHLDEKKTKMQISPQKRPHGSAKQLSGTVASVKCSQLNPLKGKDDKHKHQRSVTFTDLLGSNFPLWRDSLAALVCVFLSAVCV